MQAAHPNRAEARLGMIGAIVRRRGTLVSRAGLAQLVEHLICNQGATGSNPVAGTISFSGPEIALNALNGKEISGV